MTERKYSKEFEEKKFKKGNKCSPGRAKGSLSFKKLIKEEAMMMLEDKHLDAMPDVLRQRFKKQIKAQYMVYKLMNDAMLGDKNAVKMIIEHIDGKPISTQVNMEAESHEDRLKRIMGEEDSESDD